MDVSLPQFYAAIPEIFILSMACLILMIDACLPSRYGFLTYILVQAALIAAFFLTLPQFQHYSTVFIGFSGHYILDKLAIVSKLFIYLFSLFTFAYAREFLRTRRIFQNEYYLLGLFAVLGMSIMVSANTFLSIYLGLELLSIGLYAMVAMTKESNDAIEAAMKYIVLGALASGILLYGISLLFGATGSIQLDVLGNILQSRQDLLLITALIFILAGLLFKFGAVPFHMWVPDVYQGAATPTTLFIASAPKIAAFVITLRILVQAFPSLQNQWEHILIITAILSMFFGNVLAIAQSNLKRMLAYSSIAHIGYVLLGILAGPDSTNGYSAAMFYIATYVLVAAGAFAVITLMSLEGVNVDNLNDYRGLNARHPWLAFMMLLLLFSMAGVPPTVGFFAKLGLLEALVEANLTWLAVLALIFALIGAYYYLRVVMLMYFEEPTEEMANHRIQLSTKMTIAISVNGGAALLLGLFPSMFIELCRISFV
jgi:NADH-quinone oxidoreductase subunit N